MNFVDLPPKPLFACVKLNQLPPYAMWEASGIHKQMPISAIVGRHKKFCVIAEPQQGETQDFSSGPTVLVVSCSALEISGIITSRHVTWATMSIGLICSIVSSFL